MNDVRAQQQLAAQLEHLLARVTTLRVLRLRPEERTRLVQAIERTRMQLLGSPEPVLVVVLAGGTGVGKSALINALAGTPIAVVGDTRPTTTTLYVYHHSDVAAGALPTELASVASFVSHDRPELRTKVLIDTPDLDSFATQHRTLAKQILKAAGLVLYVFSPEKYLDERTWSVLREEQCFSASAAVLNKSDRVSPEELEQINDDLHRRFAEIGLGDIRIFRTCALAHVPQADDLRLSPQPGVDDTVVLRAFLERELRASDVVQLWHAQHQRALAHLQAEVERVAPATMLAQLDEIAAVASQGYAATAARLATLLAEPLAAVEAALVSGATLRQHERFRGPFRTWLVVTDCLRFGLRRIVRHLAGDVLALQGNLAETLRHGSVTSAMDDVLRQEGYRLQDLLYAHGFPVDRWRTHTATVAGAHLVSEVTTEMETRWHALVATCAERGKVVVCLANALGVLVLAVLVPTGLYIMSRDLLVGRYVGLPLLGHLLAMGVLFCVALQGIVSVLLPSLRRRGRGLGRQAVQTVVVRALQGWIDSYRSELAADLADMREPLAMLQAAVATRASALPLAHPYDQVESAHAR
jgi:hypothetical protein